MFGLAHDGKTTKAGIPRNPLRVALIVHDYEDEMYLAQPPLWVQRIVFGGLAKVGRLLGYSAEYPYPYGEQGEGPLRSEGEPVSAISEARTGAVVVGTILVFLVPFLLRWRGRHTRAKENDHDKGDREPVRLTRRIRRRPRRGDSFERETL